MTDIQTQILKATIQNRNDNESISRDMFEVAKKIAMDYDAWMFNVSADILYPEPEVCFAEFIEQYNP